MRAYDVFHAAVKNGLIKEGWTITDDPLYVEFGDVSMYIDLAAEKLVGAKKGDRRIAVEIKSFISPYGRDGLSYGARAISELSPDAGFPGT